MATWHLIKTTDQHLCWKSGRTVCLSRPVVSDRLFVTPMNRSPPGSSVQRILRARILRVSCHSLLQGNLLDPGIELGSPALRADPLLSEPPGKLGHSHAYGASTILSLRPEVSGLTLPRAWSFKLPYTGDFLCVTPSPPQLLSLLPD